MIQVNLIPDVKRELLAAKRVRSYVVAGAVIAGVASVGVVVLMGVYLFGVQTLRSSALDRSIESKANEIAEVDDLSNMLTLQNQVSQLSALHESKSIDSRLFDLLAAINPPAPNDIAVTSARIDAENQEVTIEGQAANGYAAAEVFRKTILGTSMSYTLDGTAKTVQLTDAISSSDASWGEDSSGTKVLRFSFIFTYADDFFSNSVKDAVINGPDKQNVTDSYLRLPQSLFTDGTASVGEGR